MHRDGQTEVRRSPVTAGVVTQPEVDASTRPWNINRQKFCYRTVDPHTATGPPLSVAIHITFNQTAAAPRLSAHIGPALHSGMSMSRAVRCLRLQRCPPTSFSQSISLPPPVAESTSDARPPVGMRTRPAKHSCHSALCVLVHIIWISSVCPREIFMQCRGAAEESCRPPARKFSFAFE
eukprot:COSAG06_NODE_3182_length_5719_cov_58.908363_3_plen_179_part_00